MAEYIYGFIFVGLLAALFAGLWKSFEKAGIDGWRALIPLYNIYLVVKISDLSGWFTLGFFIPLLNILVPVYVYYRFARNYGTNAVASFLVGLFPFLGVPVIGFGNSTYIGHYEFETDNLA